VNIEYVEIKIPGIKRNYTFYHISDLHVCYAKPTDDDIFKEFVEEHLRVNSVNGITANEALENAIEYINTAEGDGVFITGDCVDYYTDSNADYVNERLATVNKEVCAVLGNREGSELTYSRFAPTMTDNPVRWVKDFGDFLVVGVNNAHRCLRPDTFSFLEDQTKRGLPIILLMHIPIHTAGIDKPLRERYGEAATQYYSICYDRTPDDNPKNKKNNYVTRFAEFLEKKDNNIVAVLTGHVHFSSETEIANGLMQYTAGSLKDGYIRKIKIVGE